ncbi:rRNA maturation RNAse YbeY [Staphylococcus aureus]|uniref:rRNA maturation RNAse YbeY n=1 Tax=Staphylococcus aureus TaxID=1280 RepID=UPI0037DA646C
MISTHLPQQQPNNYPHSFQPQLPFLPLHPFFHLLPYDHITQPHQNQIFPPQHTILNPYPLTPH